MLQRKQYVKKTKRGNVLKVVREHYLRDDIQSGTPLDSSCPPEMQKLSKDAKHYLVVDTNIALQQMDFLEHACVDDVIIMGVVLEEVRHRNSSIYQRLRAITASPTKRFFVFGNEHHRWSAPKDLAKIIVFINLDKACHRSTSDVIISQLNSSRETYIKSLPNESVNDRNDRAIRVAAAWYAKLLPSMPILLITNDVDNLRKARIEGLNAMSVQAYARSRTDRPELADIVAVNATAELPADEDGQRAAKRQRIYPDHKAMSSIIEGMRQGRLHQGALRVNRFNSGEGWLASESVGQEILIPDRIAMNRALDGDIVAVELFNKAEWQGPSTQLPGKADVAREGGEADSDDEDGAHLAAQVAPGEHFDALTETEKRPTGKVVGIIRRNWRTRGYAGSLQPPKEGSTSFRTTSLFCPMEKKYPLIRIATRQAENLMDKRIVVAIDGWEADSKFPTGHYVRLLGVIGDRDTETEVLLLENDINTQPFTQSVHDCVPPLPWTVTEADICDPHRLDLRHLAVCSVDPPGCKDIDDALHVRELDNGNLELGVHIADVTHFLAPGTAMDDEAASRATTTYLVTRRIDMLPKPLTEDICSLRADVDRLAFSVLWEINHQTEVVHVRFTKSVIRTTYRSQAAMTYEEAQSRIDDERLQDPLSRNLRRMNQIAKILRQRRSDRGALTLASPEVKFQIDTETHNPLDVGMYQVREANQMVEEMMLLANCTVAEHILNHFPACALLRKHAVPPPRQFEPLLRAAAACDMQLDVTSSKALAESLDKALRADDPYFNKLIRILATRCMTQALYFGSGECSPAEYLHYGLAAPLYTHFTSPIRRYADVMVHRLLAASLHLSELPESSKDKMSVHALADNLNTRHRNAQMAGRASVELHTLIYFKDRSILADARITKVRSNGLIIFVPKFGIEGLVYLTSKDADKAEGNLEDKYTLDEETQTVRSEKGDLSYTIFDKVAVRISIVEGTGHRRRLQLELVDREELPATELMG